LRIQRVNQQDLELTEWKRENVFARFKRQHR
jgi:hypothetical protein